MTKQKEPNIAVVGCGYWGKNLIRNFAELHALFAVCDTDKAAAKKEAAQYNVLALDWQEVLETHTIQAIVIAAPAVMHATLAEAALLAGKHVFVEKPLALTLFDAEKLCALAEKLDRRLMVGHLLQYHPAFLKLREILRAGDLGRIQYLYSNRLNLGKIRREEDILWSFAPHDISMILSLIGSEPEKVMAVGGYYLHKTIADVTTTHLTFPGGEQAHIFVSWLHPFKEQKLIVVGDRGMAVFDDGKPWEDKLQFYPHSIAWREGMPLPARAEAISITLEAIEPLREECHHFLECIETGATPRTDGREGLRVLSVLNKATESLKTQERIQSEKNQTDIAHTAELQKNIFVHESAYVDNEVTLGAGTKIWHFSHILSRTQIGENVSIGQNVMIGPDVTVGNNCKIQNNVSLYKGVTLADGVFCGPSCVFTNVNTPRAEVDRRDEFKPTPVGKGATIGANATIVCGHQLGAYCFIAAGAVVTKDVLPHALMAGVPARRIGWVSHSGERLGADLKCPRGGQTYQENVRGELIEIETNEYENA